MFRLVYNVAQVREIELLREPTKEELEIIQDGDIFDLPEDLVDWIKEEISDEDYTGISLEDENGEVDIDEFLEQK